MTAVTEARPSEIIARHPSGALSQAYRYRGRLWTAIYLHDGMIRAHPDGGWGVLGTDDRHRKLRRDDIDAIRFLLPTSNHPPLWPGQAGLDLDIDALPDGDGDIPTLRRWSMSELLAEPDDFAWLIQGILADPTYGQVAGELKSLKTYLAAMIQVGLAAGAPILGHFQPQQARPVVAYVGEGGRRPYTRRLRRIAHAIGVRLDDLDLHIVTDVAPIQSDLFRCTLSRDLAEIGPALVCLDPLYAYHGSKVQASLLHDEGALLTGLSNRCLDADASLLVVNHMNQNGAGRDLKRITGAGGGEWVDSWILTGHRDTPDIENGEFKLWLSIGSRQWGGTTWDLDLTIGRFDQDTGTHEGDIAWDLRQAHQTATATADDREASIRQDILSALVDRPGSTKTDVKQIVGGNAQRFRQTFDHLADTGAIAHDKPDPNRKTGGRPAPRWHITEVSDHSLRTEPPDEDAF